MKVKLVHQRCRTSPVHPHLVEEVFRLLLPAEEVFGKNIMVEKYLVVTLQNPDRFAVDEAFVNVFAASEDVLGVEGVDHIVLDEAAVLDARLVAEVKKAWQGRVRLAAGLLPTASKLFSGQMDLGGYKEISPKTKLFVSTPDEVEWNDSSG